MLIVIYGDDFAKKTIKKNNVLKNLNKKKPDAIFSHLDFLDLDISKFQECLKTQGGLFEAKNIFLFSNIFLNTKLKNFFLENVEEFKTSENAFVFLEEKISASDVKLIEKYCYDIKKFEVFKKPENNFALSDYVAEKNTKKAWLEYNLLLSKNQPAEQIYPIIFFSLKSLILAEKFDLKNSGLKSYSYQKAKNNIPKWDIQNLEKKFLELISLYNQSRLSGLALKENLEKFILSLKN